MPLYIVRDDITKMDVDAVVTTARSWPDVGEGIDPLVYKAAGYNLLLKARKRLGVLQKGSAVATKAFRLHALGIIHAVFPKWQDGNSGEEKCLRTCYRNILSEALNKEYETVAIPFCSNGNFGFSNDLAVGVALEEIRSFVNTSDITVYLVVYDEYKSFDYDDLRCSDNKILYDDICCSSAPEHHVEQPRWILRGVDTSHKCESRPASKPNKNPDNEESAAGENFLTKSAKSTSLISKVLKFFFVSEEENSLEDILEEETPTFINILLKYMYERNLDRVTLYTRSNLDRKRMSKLINGHITTPSKNMVLALVIGLRLNIEEATEFMTYAGYAFNPADKTDRVVLYHLRKGNYDIDRINFDLYDHDLPSLGINVS